MLWGTRIALLLAPLMAIVRVWWETTRTVVGVTVVLKQQFGFNTVRYRGLIKNTAKIVTLFALSDLRMARRRMMEAQA